VLGVDSVALAALRLAALDAGSTLGVGSAFRARFTCTATGGATSALAGGKGALLVSVVSSGVAG
jgi:hypothetical protein